MGDEVKESCGVFGIFGDSDAAYLTYLGLQALQHRGQESCGIVSSDDKLLYTRIRMGLVAPNYSEENFPGRNNNGEVLYGFIANGHVRYSTTGKSAIENAQPLVLQIKYGKIAIAHNGNLTNALMLKNDLLNRGADFKSTTDSEVIGHLIAHSKAESLEDAIVDALQQIKGAYSLVITSKDKLYAARDVHGFRPLCIGRHNKAVVVASENYALEIINAVREREISEGELICVDKTTLESTCGYRSRQFVNSNLIKPSACMFELVYFQRPDNRVNTRSVAMIREAFGKELWKEHPIKADIVTPVPDSGNYAALGYSKASKIPLEFVFVRSHYSGRTFILPEQRTREKSVKMKLHIVKDLVDGKIIVVVDDSIIRGTTSKDIITQLKNAGAKEVHLLVSCPPTKFPCYYGMDFPKRDKLIAANHSHEDVCKIIGADSLGYLSLEGMLAVAKTLEVCTACWTGEYPTQLDDVNAGLAGEKC